MKFCVCVCIADISACQGSGNRNSCVLFYSFLSEEQVKSSSIQPHGYVPVRMRASHLLKPPTLSNLIYRRGNLAKHYFAESSLAFSAYRRILITFHAVLCRYVVRQRYWKESAWYYLRLRMLAQARERETMDMPSAVL